MSDIIIRKKLNRGDTLEWNVLEQTLTITPFIGIALKLPRPEAIKLIKFMHEIVYGKDKCKGVKRSWD